MALNGPEKRGQAGRPSKGDRHPVMVRVLTHAHEEFRRACGLRQATNSDLLGDILIKWLDAHKEELPSNESK